jgi:hypothetical protein
MNRFVSAAFLGAALLLAACSGQQTMAPNSAPPDREAQVTAGDGHHHHSAATAEPVTGEDMDHSTMTGMGHSNMQHPAAPSAAPAPDVALAVPASNAEITHTHPAARLQPDAFDAPAASAVSEAAKAAGGHEGHDAPPPADPHSGHHHGNSPKEP